MKRRPELMALRYLQLLGVGIAALGVAAAMGYYPTLRLGGGEAVRAMFAGCGVALIAGGVGIIPVCTARFSELDPAAVTNRVLLSTALRMVVALAITLSVVLSGWFPKAPLLVWIAIAYVVTLLADTVYLVGILKVTQPRKKP
ncbi:MAG: hypothetical protein KAV82_10145 [Phycisphaerae bacterium]|nr:hypothetical protein [Phycisphaerae bacterium]